MSVDFRFVIPPVYQFLGQGDHILACQERYDKHHKANPQYRPHDCHQEFLILCSEKLHKDHHSREHHQDVSQYYQDYIQCIHDFLFFLHLFQNSSSSHPLAIRAMIATGIPAMKYIRPNDTVSGHINPNATQSNLSLSGKIL